MSMRISFDTVEIPFKLDKIKLSVVAEMIKDLTIQYKNADSSTLEDL
jgi:hypothetical protein